MDNKLIEELQNWLDEHNAEIRVQAFQGQPLPLDITASLMQVGIRFGIIVVEKAKPDNRGNNDNTFFSNA
jgi:hypothetical protein